MTTVKLETSHGVIVLELNAEAAPITVENFLFYVNAGGYDGTLFHRVISGFLIEGGGLKPGMVLNSTRDPIKNEAYNGLKNKRGTLAMARTSDVHSAMAQFFINLADNDILNHGAHSSVGFGYAVFGKVVGGMDVVDKIASVRTAKKGAYSDVPIEDVLIVAARIT